MRGTQSGRLRGLDVRIVPPPPWVANQRSVVEIGADVPAGASRARHVHGPVRRTDLGI